MGTGARSSWVAAVVATAMGAMLATAPADAAVRVPDGNRNVEQPAVPGASKRRTAALKQTFEAKYVRIRDLIAGDDGLRRKIVRSAKAYDIDPVHIAGALVGEHTYNVDAYDRLQSYYVKAVSYARSDFSFGYRRESVDRFVSRQPFGACEDKSGSWEVWACREDVWESVFRGRTVDGVAWPDNRFSAVFFQPFYAGQTFGLGQLNPLTALKLSDDVNTVSGHRRLDHRDAAGVYRAIMDPDITLDYMAAALRRAIDAYREIAGFDISGNPGITATLYNVGTPDRRAAVLAAENRKRAAAGRPRRLPQENYYGWLVNAKLDELTALFE